MTNWSPPGRSAASRDPTARTTASCTGAPSTTPAAPKPTMPRKTRLPTATRPPPWFPEPGATFTLELLAYLTDTTDHPRRRDVRDGLGRWATAAYAEGLGRGGFGG